ncbi:TonB-dependent receptor [Chitinophagaceae bacterium 26-R-25]|nr:TonB-dependent receptor [Chitinophagaceae bacterium 26-R-25]
MAPVSRFITILSTACLLLFAFLFAHAGGNENGVTIKGKVTTADNKPAAYVTVIMRGTNKSAITDDDGGFSFFNIAPGTYELEVSLVGHTPATHQVKVEDKDVHMNIQLTTSSKELQEVIVVGGRNKFTKKTSDYVSKMPLKNMENPQVYTTITKALMDDQLIFSVDEAMKNATGISKMWQATGRGGDGGTYYNSRGFVLQSKLRNGVAGNVSNQVDAANLERIEAIKGPSATLFGSTLTSYGGLINRITKKPYDRFGGEISYAGGSYNFNRFSADINTPLDSAHKVLLRVNAAYNYEGSFQDAGFSRNIVLAPSLSYKVNDKLSFSFDAEFYSGRNTAAPLWSFIYGTPIASLGANRADQLKVDYKRSYLTNDLYQTSNIANFFGQMNYNFSDKWRSQTNFSITNSASNGPSTFIYLLPNSAISGNPSDIGNGYITRNDFRSDNSSDQVIELQQNFIGESKIGNLKNRFVSGVDYFRQHTDQVFSAITFDTVNAMGSIPNYNKFNRVNLDAMYATKGPDFSFPTNFVSNTYSAYAFDVLNLTDNLLVTAGLRFDHFVNEGTFDKTTGQITPGTAYNQSTVSPKFGIIYQPIKDRISIFGNYQNGFTNKNGVDYALNPFKPEHANQFEGGVKLDMLGGKLSSTVSYYYIKVKDIVRSYPIANNPFAQIQDGTQLSKGIEVEVTANPVSGLNLVAGFAYNDSKYTKADASVQGRRPETAGSPYNANLWINYRLPAGSIHGLGMGFGGNYASDNMVINRDPVGQFTLPAYTVLGATLFYDQPKYKFVIKMDNIANKHYFIGYNTVNPQKLRSVTANVTFRF